MSRCKCQSCNRPAREDGYCLTHSPARQREARATNKDRFKGYSLQRDYGITIGQYLEMLEVQNGCCAICGRKDLDERNNNNGSKRLSVDHNHDTGIIRGLLCTMCNKGIGSLMESSDLLRKAADYLDSHAKLHNQLIQDTEDMLDELAKL